MFRRSTTHRLATVFLVVLSLLFSQLALASYVCPKQADPDAMAQRMAAGEPCEGMGPAQPVLCHQHCAEAAQCFEAIKLPAATSPAIVHVIVLLPVPVVDEGCASTLVAPLPEARPPPDPVFLSTLRLRV